MFDAPTRLDVEDEIWSAIGLEEGMHTLGFDICDLAASAQQSLPVGNEPSASDIVLMDVCLEGGREGIEAARWLREVCDVPIVFVTANTDASTIERIHQQVPGALVLPKPAHRARLAAAVAAVT